MTNEAQAFREHRPALLRYLFQLTDDVGLAEDIVQESYLRLLEREGMPENPRGWLFRVATNLVRGRPRVDGVSDRGRYGLIGVRRAPASAPPPAFWPVAELQSAIISDPEAECHDVSQTR